MHRRAFLRGAVPLSLAPKLLLAQQSGAPAPPPPAPVPWTLGLNPATPLPATVSADAVAGTELRFFSPAQMATLQRLAALLLPPMEGRPGAVEAGAPAFLDFLIGSSPETRQGLYAKGLDWMDGASQAKYGKGFATLTDAEAGTLVGPWLRTWMTDHPPVEAHADFVNIAHADIRTATVNSIAWSKAAGMSDEDGQKTPVALFWQPIEPDMAGNRAACVQTKAPVEAAPKSEHTLPTYPQ